MSGTGFLTESELLSYIDSQPSGIPADVYQHLSTIICAISDLDEIKSLDPFGEEYRARVMAVYHRLAARPNYDATVDEKSGIAALENIWRDSSPFSFRSTPFVSEFLLSWSTIFASLDAKEGMSVIEYGPGSGQLLILLARTGVNAYGVDIDQASLDLVRAQADAMSLDVQLERNFFGAGFEGRRFDRIVFFEAFHHAATFRDLLNTLHERLNEGGFVLFCGEPIVPPPGGAVPYPWGPRLDALSVLCMRRYGWMELGFQTEFFRNLLMAHGWLVECSPNSAPRAIVYKAKPCTDTIPICDELWIGDGWSEPEGTHRWTLGRRTCLTLPWARHPNALITAVLANFLPEQKSVNISIGEDSQLCEIESGADCSVQLTLRPPYRELLIETSETQIGGDPRNLGIAVRSITISPTSAQS